MAQSKSKGTTTKEQPQKPQIRIKVSTAQRETLRAAAERKGLGIGPWMRTVCLELAETLLRAA